MIVTFCGHSEISEYCDVETWLFEVVEDLIKGGATEFYLGGYGGFDLLAGRVVTALKAKYPNVQRTLVIPYINRPYDKALYDNSYYPALENVPPRYAILKRNQRMVEEADVVVAYVKYTYGGATKTLTHAKKKQKPVINFPNKLTR